MLDRLWEPIRARNKDGVYYVRLVTGLLAVAFFFAAGAFIAGEELSQYSGFVRQTGNVFYYSSVSEVVGSAGQQLVSAVLALIAFIIAAVVVVRRFRFGLVNGVKSLATVLLFTGITFGAFGGFLGNGVVQLFLLGSLNLRVLWWALMPLLYLGGLYGAWYYAKEGEGTVLDM